MFRQADKLKPNQGILQLTIARTMLSLRQYDETAAYIRTIIEHDKTFGAAYDLLYGIAMLQTKQERARLPGS